VQSLQRHGSGGDIALIFPNVQDALRGKNRPLAQHSFDMPIEIKHLAGVKETIDDSTPIVRYMKLSTLLLLLADRVFLPSLRCLQSHDKFEGLIPKMRSIRYDYGKLLYPRIERFKNWLLQQAEESKIIPVEGGKHNTVTPKSLAKLWVEQLSIRRCVWCWNKQIGPSHALWKIYGQRGVAVVSTVGDVKQALAKAGPLRAIVSPVSYSLPPAFSYDDAAKASFEMTRPENLPFPYLFKDAGYKYEEEVRFVFGVHPNLLAGDNGIVAEINGKSLVQSHTSNLWISRDIPKEENNMIRYLVADIRKGSCPNFPYPAEQDTVRLERFRTVGGNPFTLTEEPVGLFTDLD